MIKLNVETKRIVDAADIINRVKPDFTLLQTIKGKLNFKLIKDGDVILYEVKETEQDIGVMLEIDNTVSFNRMTKYFEKDSDTITLEIDKGNVVFKSDTRDLRTRSDYYESETPNYELEEILSQINIEGEKLKDIVDTLDVFRGGGDARPHLSSITIDENGFHALDGYKLGLYHYGTKITNSYELQGHTVDYLKRFLVKHKDDYTIQEIEENILIHTGLITIITSEKSRREFDYESLLRTDHDFEVELDSTELLNSADYVKNMGEVSVITFRNGAINIEAGNEGNIASANIDYKLYNGEVVRDFKMGINPNYLNDVIKIYDKDSEIKLGFAGHLNPVVIRDEKLSSLILPVRLNGGGY